MITVEVYRNADGRIRGFRSTGHAGYGEYGEDIVCAAVSAITQTTVIGLMNHLELPVAVKQASGLLECTLAEDSPGKGEQAQALFETMVLGLSEVERQYPKQVRLRNVSL